MLEPSLIWLRKDTLEPQLTKSRMLACPGQSVLVNMLNDEPTRRKFRKLMPDPTLK
jgi:hypothetical protein